MPTVAIDELQALTGKETGVSDWLTIDQAMIDRFADATLDHQFIHVDAERAAQTPFGGTIAHGFLTLSLLSYFSAHADLPRPAGIRMGVNYGLNKVRFVAPVHSGKRVRARFKLLELAEKRPGQFQQTNEVTVEIDGEDKPALIAEWIGQFFI